MASKNLAGRTVVITRPQHQALRLAEQIQEQGGRALICPMLEILPVENLSVDTENLAQYSILIFVSANAVQSELRKWRPSLPTRVIAIGPGTAQALSEQQMQVTDMPESHHSEGILALPVLQNINDVKIAIFCGENTRPLLKDILTARGAQVKEIICYRHSPPNIDAQQILRDWKKHAVDIIISTSLESLKNLWLLFGHIDSTWLLSRGLLVISPKMAAQAKQWSFQNIILADDASDQAVFAALVR